LTTLVGPDIVTLTSGGSDMVRRAMVGLAVVLLALPSAVSSAAPTAEPAAVVTGGWQWFANGSYLVTLGQQNAPTLACRIALGNELPMVVDWRAVWQGWVVTPNGASSVADYGRYGQPGDHPVCGSWEGQSSDGFGVVRGAQWYLRNSNPVGGSSQPPDHSFVYGRYGDIPLVGDWDGDGVDTPGVRRGNTFYLRDGLSGGPADRIATYGRSTDIPIVGDWDGDGVDTIGVVRNAVWYLTDTLGPTGNRAPFRYGRFGDRPVPADINGDLIADPMVARAS
jgi:hypothetical protein